MGYALRVMIVISQSTDLLTFLLNMPAAGDKMPFPCGGLGFYEMDRTWYLFERMCWNITSQTIREREREKVNRVKKKKGMLTEKKGK